MVPAAARSSLEPDGNVTATTSAAARYPAPTNVQAQRKRLISGSTDTSATRKDPVSGHHAPAGVETLEVMTMVPSEPEIWGVSPEELQEEGYRKKPEYLERKQRVEDDLVHRLETLFPGLGQHIVFRESSTPLSHNRYTRSTAGGGYGIACTPEQFGVNRPGPRSEVPGLYLAGASTISGHGILGSLSSGKVAAKVVGKDLDDE